MANGTFFASLVRLYQATFDRPSDSAGVGYWASRLAKGEMTFQEVAQSFMESDEFREKYGEALTNKAFVTLLYENVLDREPDEEGLAHWLQVMEEGSLRHEVLLGFSESGEHVDKIDSEHSEELAEAEAIENGLEDEPEEDLDDNAEGDAEDDLDDDAEDDLNDDAEDDLDDDAEDDLDDDADDELDDNAEGDVNDGLSDEEELILLYNAAFDRKPDQEGLGHWMGELASSKVEFEDIIELFMESEEFTDRYGENLANDDFIETLYNNTLDRASDDQGKGFWISQLASGRDRGDILELFVKSDEHIDIVLAGTHANAEDTFL